MNHKRLLLSDRLEERYTDNAKVVKFLREHPSIAAEELLGIRLIDAQKFVLENAWNTPNNIITCTRGFGKSFLLAVIAMLKMLLYPNYDIYLIASVGSQARETFLKLESIAKQQISTIPSLKDIFLNEVKESSNSDGFKKDPASYTVAVLNRSQIFTLNANPDNVRGKRARLLLYDESSFISEELITNTLPFIIINSDVKISTDDDFNIELEAPDVPNQVIMASSAGAATSYHAQKYREWGIKMIEGDKQYFACDITCEVPLHPLISGKPAPALFSQARVDDDMQSNPQKAMREYFNKFDTDGGEEQPIKMSMIRDAETFVLPVLERNEKYSKYLIAFDPARLKDSSIIGVMGVYMDDTLGYCGDVIYANNLFDKDSSKEVNLMFGEQVKALQTTISKYIGNAKRYGDIAHILIDSGAGGGGTLYADQLLLDWTDEHGIKRSGIIDKDHKAYVDKVKDFPHAADILTLVSTSMKKVMLEELVGLMLDGVINFPQEYDNKGYVNYIDEETGELVEYMLSIEERVALKNIDIMKYEATAIRKYGESIETDKLLRSKVGDDRYDVFAMLGHGLYELRRTHNFQRGAIKKDLSAYLRIL